MADQSSQRTEHWNPEDYASIGKCVACGDAVYPANRDEVGARDPVMHEGCGW